MITQKQLELLSYINLIFNTRGEAPTYMDMLKMTGLSSKASVSARINGLVRLGYLNKKGKGKSNIEITEKGKMNDKVFRLCPMCGHLTQ